MAQSDVDRLAFLNSEKTRCDNEHTVILAKLTSLQADLASFNALPNSEFKTRTINSLNSTIAQIQSQANNMEGQCQMWQDRLDFLQSAYYAALSDEQKVIAKRQLAC